MVKLAGITKDVSLSDPIYEGSNFIWGEATKGATRLPVQTTIDGIVVPAAQITANIIKIARELDTIRSQFGNRPITVNSWYRDPVSNRAVGGVRNSQHLWGWAVDIRIDGYLPSYVAAQLKNSWAGGLGDSASFTHLDLRHLLGRASARWDYGNA